MSGIINSAYGSDGASSRIDVGSAAQVLAGGVQDSRYAVQLFSMKMLKRFYGTSAYELISNTDYEGEIKKAGDSVVIRRAPEMDISPYDPDVDIVYQTPGDSAETLNIDQALYWAYRLDDVDEVASNLPLMNKFTENSALQLKVAIDTNCLASWVTGAHADNQGAAVTGLAGAISGDLKMGITTNPRVLTSADIMVWIHECNQILDEQDIPEYDRFIVLPAWCVSLLKDSDIKAADTTGDSKGVIRTGVLGMIDGLTLVRSNHLPWNGGTNETSVLFGTKEACTFAMQLTETEHVRIPKRFGKYVRGLAVFGRSVPQSAALGVSIIQKG